MNTRQQKLEKKRRRKVKKLKRKAKQKLKRREAMLEQQVRRARMLARRADMQYDPNYVRNDYPYVFTPDPHLNARYKPQPPRSIETWCDMVGCDYWNQHWGKLSIGRPGQLDSWVYLLRSDALIKYETELAEVRAARCFDGVGQSPVEYR
tara:strand:- start:9799 stop:10248 length:450 start_codon:yes stop_codon:yes gene_type:complete